MYVITNMHAPVQMGGEAGVSNPQMEKMKTFFRAFTILLIPITAQFPTVSRVVVSNFISRCDDLYRK